MSLRVRLLLVLVAVNLALLLAAQLTSWAVQRSWLDRNREIYEKRIHDHLLRYAFGGEPGASDGDAPLAFLRRLLAPRLRGELRTYLRDLFLVARASDGMQTEISPLGAVLRDPGTFPLEEVRAGIDAATRERRLIRAANGFCLAVIAEDHVVVGAWFEPVLPPPPQVPATAFAIPLLVGTLLFGFIAHWLIGRGLVRPLRTFGITARKFGEGRYDLRMPAVSDVELAVFTDAFNAMAERIEGHHDELAREVANATEEAKRKERALLQSARLAAVGTLAAGIAHEINNPIGGMQNAIRRLEAREGLGDRERTYLGLIHDGLDRVARITRRVLDFSPKQVAAVPFPVEAAIDGARALVEHRMRLQGVEFVVTLPGDLPLLVGDRHEFQQVLLNLFINSLDVLEGRPTPRQITVTARRLGDRLELVVADNGPGMARELLPRVMDPFFSGKGRPDASGLGMFISYSIVRNHGGEMEVDSAPGQGFRTRIVLPCGG